jgi:hypothetical protein
MVTITVKKGRSQTFALGTTQVAAFTTVVTVTPATFTFDDLIASVRESDIEGCWEIDVGVTCIVDCRSDFASDLDLRTELAHRAAEELAEYGFIVPGWKRPAPGELD